MGSPGFGTDLPLSESFVTPTPETGALVLALALPEASCGLTTMSEVYLDRIEKENRKIERRTGLCVHGFTLESSRDLGVDSIKFTRRETLTYLV